MLATVEGLVIHEETVVILGALETFTRTTVTLGKTVVILGDLVTLGRVMKKKQREQKSKHDNQ